MTKSHETKLQKYSRECNELGDEIKAKSKINPRTKALTEEIKTLINKQSKLRKKIDKLNGNPPAKAE